MQCHDHKQKTVETSLLLNITIILSWYFLKNILYSSIIHQIPVVSHSKKSSNHSCIIIYCSENIPIDKFLTCVCLAKYCSLWAASQVELHCYVYSKFILIYKHTQPPFDSLPLLCVNNTPCTWSLTCRLLWWFYIDFSSFPKSDCDK